MNRIIKYNSWEDKAPFGALLVNGEVSIKLRTNENFKINNVVWVIFKEDKEVERVYLSNTGENEYIGKSKIFNTTGLYFYHFEAQIQEVDHTYTVFYGRSHKDASSCRYYEYHHINKYQITVHEDYQTPKWYKEGLMYNIFVDRFNNGNRNKKINNPKKNSFIYANWEDEPMYIKEENGDIARWDFYGGNLAGIIAKLGYLKRLGVTMIYLNPIFEARSNHKYDTADYKKIDSMFGDEEIFKELIEKANEKGISIILDGVFNHVGADSKYFNRFGNYDNVGAYQSLESEYSSWFNFKKFPEEYDGWWGVMDLPNVNELDENFMNYIIYNEDSVINKWTSMGVKGWRLDVVDELPTHFVKELKKELRKNSEDTILIGEVWEDASNKMSYGVRRSYFEGQELDSVMGYPFRCAMLDFLKFNITSTQLNNRFMSVKENYPKEAFKSNLNLISSHDEKRIKTELNEDVDLVKLAVITQMTFEGIPYIYYGDEAGLTGDKDPNNRKTYPWKNEDEDMVNFYRHASVTRNRFDILIHGDTRFIQTNDDDVFAYERYDDENKMLVVINRSNDAKNIKIESDKDTMEEINIAFSAKKYLERFYKQDNKFDINIDAKSYKIYNLINEK